MSDMKLNLELTATDKGLSGTLKKGSQSVSEMSKEFQQLERTLNPATAKLGELQKAQAVLDQEFQSGRLSLDKYNKMLHQVDANYGQTATGGLAKLRGATGQLGYQIQDIAVQLQMGTNAMTVFGQQGSQIASIFGPGGAVLGAVIAIGSAIGGTLVGSLMRGSQELEGFNERMDSVKSNLKSIQLEGINADIKQQEIVVKRLTAEMNKYDTLLKLRPDLEAVWADAKLKNKAAIEEATKALETEQQALAALLKTRDDINNKDNPEIKRKEDVDSFINSLKAQVGALGLSGAALAEYEAGLLGATEAEKEQIVSLYMALDADKARIALQKEALISQEKARTEQEKMMQVYDSLVKKLDPVAAKFKEVAASQKFLIDNQKALGLSDDSLDKMLDKLNLTLDEAAESSSKSFEDQFSQTGDRIASTLQDAIATDEWAGVGKTVGGIFAGSLAGVVTDTLIQTMGSSAFTSVLGPVIGGVVGGIAALAVNTIGDYLAGEDLDPTEQRQAAQGTGTVLGSINEKSKSIANSTELIAEATDELVNINMGMLQALKSLQLGIDGVVSMTLRQSGNVSFTTPQIDENFFKNDLGSFFGGAVVGGILNAATLGLGSLLGDAFGKILGGKSKKVDEGIRILGGNIQEMIGSSFVQAYSTYKEKGSFLDDYDLYESHKDLGEEVNKQFGLIFQGIIDSASEGALALGIDQSEIQSRLNEVILETQRISLEGLDAAAKQAEIEAVFSTVFDKVASTVVPYIGLLQKGGETLGETLARVSTEFSLSQEAYATLGFQVSKTLGDLHPALGKIGFLAKALNAIPVPVEMLVKAADDLVTLVGGIEAFSAALIGFEKNFLSAEEQTATTTRRLADALGDLPLPATRDGFRDLIKIQDVLTESGRENIAMLLGLQDVASEYYATLERIAEEETDLRIRLLQTQGNSEAALALQREKELNATDASNRALLERIYLLEDEEQAANTIRNTVSDSFAALNRAINTELDALREAHDLRVETIENEISTVGDAIAALGSFRQSLNQALDSIYQKSFADQSDYIEAQQLLFGYLAAIKSGDFYTPDSEITADVLRTLASNSSSGYSSAADFERDQRLTANALKEVLSLTDGQLSIEEQTLKQLALQLETEQSLYDLAVKDLNQTREFWQSEINAINGVDDSIVSVEDALAKLTKAMQDAWENIGITNQDIRDWLAAQGPGLTLADINSAITSSGVTNRQVADALNLMPGSSFSGSDQNIRDWLAANQGLSDVDIGTAMRSHGVTAERLAPIVGLTVSDVNARYLNTIPSQVKQVASLPTDSGLSDQDVSAWLSANPNATTAEIAAAMREYGVTLEQMARVTGWSLADVKYEYFRAINGSHASGLDRVPFDGYVAELHQGEMVLPREQSDYLRGGELANQLAELRREIEKLRSDNNSRLDNIKDAAESSAAISAEWQRGGIPTYSMEAV